MPPKSLRTPAYRLHRSSGQARVIVGGRHIYLGRFNSPASKEKYHRLVAELLSQGLPAITSTPQAARGNGTVNELLLRFMQHAAERYVKQGKPTSEIRSFRTALRPVRELYGRQNVNKFGPLALTACRAKLIAKGYCRRRINGHVRRIQRVFQWGVAHELVDTATWQALLAVEGLKPGAAKELPPIGTVRDEHIAAIEPFVTPQIWALVQLQLWTACRPGEACQIRGVDIVKRDSVWEYRPASHKSEHHEKERLILLGPHAQEVLRPFLTKDLSAFIFRPQDGRGTFNANRRRNRATPMTPSQRRRQAKGTTKFADHYSTGTYDHAIRRACDRAGVPRWTPNQLRHTAATRIRAEFGIEAARVILGHSSPSTTEIYAEIAMTKAKEVIAKLG